MAKAPPAVLALVEQFKRHRDDYHAPDAEGGKYNETRLRRDYLDPLFKALGWDIDNEKGFAEAYREVVHEDAIKIGGTTKAPDYSFRIGGQRKFFVEAKKPSVNLKDDPAPALQLRRYAWTAKLPVSILSDFEEFAVYDCRKPPRADDKPHTARLDYFTFDQLEARWPDLVALFSPQAIQQGAFDKYASKKRTRGTASVDDVFLDQLEAWRQDLAKHLLRQNQHLTQRPLNHAVQLIIDRIIFLRICEDRGIEPAGQLLALTNGSKVYQRLQQIFRGADAKYNSGLFHFEPEPGRDASPDTLTPDLTVGDKPLKDILKALYPPESPYEFSVLPADILGQVYERFLGSVISLSTTGKTATVEQKPEVRKAGGVYYTPRYIVDYIVQHTVGELLKDRKIEPKGRGKNRKPQLTKPLTVLDPACGSGSFLLGAYDHLLAWHLTYYTKHDPQSWARLPQPPIAVRPRPRNDDDTAQNTFDFDNPGVGDWKLTTAEKKRILLEHLYGVDIDAQAVEVTKLSLLLKVLEGENEETVQKSLFARERALPDLSHNIKCGNSLIGTDFYAGQQMSMFTEDDLYRINAFDWHTEFPNIMKSSGGGFDAVIGNPPYLSFSGRQAVELPESEKQYFETHFHHSGWASAHALFAIHSLSLTRRLVSMIVPDQMGHLSGYANVRTNIQEFSLRAVRYWGEEVFKGVTTPALTFVIDRDHQGPTKIHPQHGDPGTVVLSDGNVWRLPSLAEPLLKKLDQQSKSLGTSVADPGVHSGNSAKKIIVKSEERREGDVPVLEGKQVNRFLARPPKKMLRLNYKPTGNEYFTVRPRQKYAEATFVIRQTAGYPIVGPRDHADYFRNSLLALYPTPDDRDTRFIVGVLNSSLLRFVYETKVHEASQRAFPQVKVRSLRDLPIRVIDFDDPADVAKHDRMVELVQTMLDLNRQLHGNGSTTEPPAGPKRRALEGRLATTDREIDQLVYTLYGLTDDEIALVEQATER